jgi:hypothetical protein
MTEQKEIQVTNQDKAAAQLRAIQEALVAAFSDYCEMQAPGATAALMKDFAEHRLNLVFTMNATAVGTDLLCSVLPMGAPPSELRPLFSAYSPAAGPTGVKH